MAAFVVAGEVASLKSLCRVGKKLLGDAVHRHRFGINTPPRVEVDVKMATGEVSIDELHTANFNHPIAVTPIQPGSLGVEHNLSHDLS